MIVYTQHTHNSNQLEFFENVTNKMCVYVCVQYFYVCFVIALFKNCEKQIQIHRMTLDCFLAMSIYFDLFYFISFQHTQAFYL